MIDTPGLAFSPSADRNKVPIGEHLLPLIPPGGRVLEVASGSGQHGMYMVENRPDIHWQLSDCAPQALENLEKLVSLNPQNTSLLPPIRLDVTDANWWEGLEPYDVVYCANMIHIAPREALPGLAQGIAKILKPGGVAVLYGPFLDGDNSAPSNIAFDAALKARNSDWGVYDLALVKHIFVVAGLTYPSVLILPRDNSLLVFRLAG